MDTGLEGSWAATNVLLAVSGESAAFDFRAPDLGVTFPFNVEGVGVPRTFRGLGLGDPVRMEGLACRGGFGVVALPRPASLGATAFLAFRNLLLRAGVNGLDEVCDFCLSAGILDNGECTGGEG